MSKTVLKIRRKSDGKILTDIINDTCQVHNIYDGEELMVVDNDYNIGYVEGDGFLDWAEYEEVTTMTQEQKDKLFKYLCLALPYGLKVYWEGCDYGDKAKNLVTIDEFGTINDEFQVENCKPYLRPLESMTEEELKELNLFVGDYAYVYYNSCVKDLDFRLNNIETIPNLYFDIFINIQNWLLAHHFDFMRLIPMGAAIEVTDDNNPYKNIEK